jgi:hypothetical protein
MGPLIAYNVHYQSNGLTVPVPLAAGGNVGIIRNPLGDFADPLAMPRIVAAN